MTKKKRADRSLKGKKPSNKAKMKRPTAAAATTKTASAAGAAKSAPPRTTLRNPGHITNKLKRSEMYGKYLEQKRKRKEEGRRERKELEERAAAASAGGLGLEDDADANRAFAKRTPRTLESAREIEPTMVTADDAEVLADEGDDEFAAYFAGDEQPKVLITTRPRPSQNVFHLIADLQQLIPGLEFYPRQSFSVKEICQFAQHRGFSHVMILSEKNKICNGLTISHVGGNGSSHSNSSDDKHKSGSSEDKEQSTTTTTPTTTVEQSSDDTTNDNPSTNTTTTQKKRYDHWSSGVGGPTAFFKVSNVVTSKRIPNHGRSTHHIPELNLHGFGTRLGHRIGRLLGSLFPHDAVEFQGRQVVTFHNQRDYLFVRRHRYIFNDISDSNPNRIAAVKDHDKTNPMPHVQTRLQELGPRFTLKLRWIQEGIFDTQFGEYEWIHKRKEMDVTRRKFHL